ncbi:Chromatin structure-remodeling complex subunit sfh1 [Neolecta irregularis DAH-3]|uniref:Chromatin structure-remodeling complex subunit sfh1 n=1 Tax=Neolecta irregularis (strain DAH-3) TaxID=1198029 RepID=A0A1U7LTS2_NEOID|nr:Chromatin structure-remodeling complex subunit sfh1 [Neolecta irregularis DAH-3]|eukprot:OLL26044.1 Chromatin structure-remodeling complex subunit sfh1 [Neolecta irregularis DAH-3]
MPALALPPAHSQPQASYSSYPSRIRLGSTSLLTQTPALAKPARAARSAYLDRDDDDPSDNASNTDEPVHTTEDVHGFVTAPPPDHLVQRKFAQRTRHRFPGEQELRASAEHKECLVPIRLDLDLDTYRLKDVFMWNLHGTPPPPLLPPLTRETMITPELFAQILCQDLEIPAAIFSSQISSSIKTQLQEYAPVARIELPENHDMRVIVNMSLHLSKHLLTDQFEWDLNSPLTPESFSQQLCADLGLSGEFHPTISHALHETLLRLKKEACEGGLPNEIDNDAAFNAEAGVRIDQEGLGANWAPVIEILSREEVEKRDGDRERQVRRLRRETSRFAPGVKEARFRSRV